MNEGVGMEKSYEIVQMVRANDSGKCKACRLNGAS